MPFALAIAAAAVSGGMAGLLIQAALRRIDPAVVQGDRPYSQTTDVPLRCNEARPLDSGRKIGHRTLS